MQEALPVLPAWSKAYLKRLGVQQRAADLEILKELCRSHLQAFPYENVSKLLYYHTYKKSIVPPPAQYVENASRYDYGGTCYAINANFLALLRELGYSGYLVSLAEDHAAIIITDLLEDGEPLYVDAGAAAPFFQPVRFLTDPDYLSAFGKEAVQLVPDPLSPSRFRFHRMRSHELVSDSWHFSPHEPRELHDFSAAIVRSFAPGATFLSMLRIHLYQLDQKRSVSLKNNSLWIMQENGEEQKFILRSIDELEAAITEEFRLPRLPIREAVTILNTMDVDIFSQED